MTAAITLVALLTIANLLVLGLHLKLYTEILKLKNIEARRRPERSCRCDDYGKSGDTNALIRDEMRRGGD